MADHVLDIDQELSDDEFVKAYWDHLYSFTEDELRAHGSVVTDRSRKRLEGIARKHQEKFRCEKKASREGCECPTRRGFTPTCELGHW